jgi:hypothetical protein
VKGFEITGHKLNTRKFWDYVKLSLYWGYNFAGELLAEKEKPPKEKLRKSN